MADMSTLVCTKCSSENEQDSRFCRLCGSGIGTISSAKTSQTTSGRRHDVDAIRVIALGLLILYHIAVAFQPWGADVVMFIENEQSLEWVWILMMVINIWRIPILFVVSGMGARFAMERRNWSNLLSDRSLRIMVPLVFGMFFIVPFNFIIFNYYYEKEQFYFPHPGHLWFLANIFFYVLIFCALFNYFKNHPGNMFYRFIKNVISKPLGVIPVFALPIVIESILIQPENYPDFVFTIHGLLLGMVCFFSGFVLVSLKEVFWTAVRKIKLITLVLALSLYLLRAYNVIITDSEFISSPLIVNVLTGFESANWMLAAFGFGAAFLNKPSKLLDYLSSAVYPVYIVHLPVQMLCSSLVFPLSIPVIFKLIIVLIGTFALSFAIYEIIKRIKWVRFLFGMKIKSAR
jgi:peptidoglycan/LPS O-acetylase OafA/YrhL